MENMNKQLLSTFLVLSFLGGCKQNVSQHENDIASSSDNKNCTIVSTTGNNSPAIGNVGNDNSDNTCTIVTTTGKNSPAIGSMNNSSITYK